ncbi:MAG: InlB B-repeat-containing protein, partial [Paludibacteraceae bacterium]|nr:InlB B-repeat-containing protein [Paludibacteraceae bacterium]
MKKVFSILCLLMLGTGIGWAYDFLFFPDYQGWSDYGTTGSGSSQRRRALYVWNTNGGNPKLGLVVSFKTNTAVVYETRTYPAKGNYTFSTSEAAGRVAAYYWSISSSKRYSYWLNSSGTMYYPASGTVNFAEGGGDAPYVTCSSMGVENASGTNVGSVSFACGTEAQYATITIARNNNSMGSASAAYKSGYIYPDSRVSEYKIGSIYTLTASPNSGYVFVEWQKNGSRISTTATTDVTIDGNATYTAVFEAEGVSYADGTITAAPSNASYGTVTGTADAATFVSGTNYAGGTSISLTATPNAGYYFVNWSDGITSASRSFTVDGAKNIVANFEAKTNYTYNWTWAEALTNGVNDWNSSSGIANSTYILYQIQALHNGGMPAASFSFCLDYTNDGYWTYDSDVSAPGVGEYPVDIVATSLNGIYKNHLICNASYVNQQNSSKGTTQNKSFYQDASRELFTSGSVMIEFGRHGDPYLYTKNLENATSTFDLSIGEGRNLTTTYTSVTVGTNADNNKAVMYANDGENTLCLAFDVASIDANIGIPAGTYTIGSNVNGTLADDDDMSHWKLTGGTITISKSGSRLSMTTSSLTSVDEDGYDHDMNLTISNLTPSLTTITNIPVSSTVNKYSGYFNVQGTSGTYSVALESASVDYRTGFFGNYELEQTNDYTYLKNNNSHISLNYKRQMMNVIEIGSKIFTEAYLCSTSGTIYRIAAFNGAYTITYKDQSNVAYTGSNAGALPTSHIYGSTTTLVDGVKAGATFNGWYENAACTGSPITSIGATAKTASFTLYAKWTPLTYTVTVAKNNNDYGTLTNESENVRVINNVPYGSTFTVDGSTITINGTTVTATPTTSDAQYTYGFSGWTNGAATVTGAMTITANFTRTTNTYDITWKSEDGTSTLETDNAQAYGTATAYNEAIPTKTVTGYTYTFDGWATSANGEKAYNNGETPTVSGAATYYAHFTGTANTHTLAWVANGGTLTGGTAAGTTAYGTALTAPTATRAGYTFNGWSPSVPATMPDDNATYTAQWNIVPYTINYEGLEGATNSNPTSYNVETATIVLADPGTRDGYIFAGWKDESDNTITQIAKGSTGDRTLTATWNVKSSNIELCENCNDAHYNTFKANYNNEKVNVTYKRQFTAERWSTMCLPFSLDLATMIANKMYGCVYEF